MQPRQYERLMERLSQPPASYPAPWGYEEHLTPHCRPENVPAWSEPPKSSEQIGEYLFPLGFGPAMVCAAKAFLIVAESLPDDAFDRRILPWINSAIAALLQGDQKALRQAEEGLSRVSNPGPPEQGIAEGPLRDAVIAFTVAMSMHDEFPLWDREHFNDEAALVYELVMQDIRQTVMFLAAVYVQELTGGRGDPWPLVREFYEQWWNRCMCTLAYRDTIYTDWDIEK